MIEPSRRVCRARRAGAEARGALSSLGEVVFEVAAVIEQEEGEAQDEQGAGDDGEAAEPEAAGEPADEQDDGDDQGVPAEHEDESAAAARVPEGASWVVGLRAAVHR